MVGFEPFPQSSRQLAALHRGEGGLDHRGVARLVVLRGSVRLPD